MQKVPFTPLGLQTLLQQLYTLSDPALELEVQAFEIDSREWLMRHFDFDEQQLQYLEQMSDAFLDIIVGESAYFLINRLPMALMQEKKDEDVGKLFEVSRTERNIYAAGSGIKKVQTLIFTISYSLQ